MFSTIGRDDASGHLVGGLKRHPQLSKWLATDHPISINTDDPGVFDTDATQELVLVCLAHNVSITSLKTIVLNSVDHAFLRDDDDNVCKSRLKESMLTLM